MSYIWENDSKRKIFRRGRFVSPYLEVMSSGGEDGVDFVNPLLRFAGIFDELAALEDACDGPAGKAGLAGPPPQKLSTVCSMIPEIENVLFHCLAALDLLHGIDSRQVKADALERNILNGAFGTYEAAHWNELSRHDQRVILYTLTEKYESETAKDFFFQAVQKLFDRVSLIYEKSDKIYYLYISSNKTDYRDTLMSIVTQLFWSIQCKLQIIWRYHYGIIGVEDTMRISEICIL